MYKIINNWNYILLYFSLFLTYIISDKANTKDKIIQTSYSSFNGDYRVFLYFNQYTCTSIFGVNLSRNYTVLSNYMYPGRCSTKKQLSFIDYNNNSFNTVECWGNPDLSKEPGELNNLTFYVLKDSITIGAKFYIGFAFHFDNENYSIVHQMYNNGTISHKSVAFSPDRGNNYENGTMFYGGIPDEFIINKRRAYCSVNENLQAWGCSLNKLSFNGKEYKNSYLSMFSLSDKEIIIPPMLMSFIEDEILMNYIKDNECKKDSSGMYTEYYCKESVMESFPELTLEFERFQVTIPIKRMFHCDFASNCIYQIKSRENVNDMIVLGVPFMGLFDVLFDYEAKQVVFYDYILLKEVISPNLRFYILFNIILLLAGIATIAIFIFTKRN